MPSALYRPLADSEDFDYEFDVEDEGDDGEDGADNEEDENVYYSLENGNYCMTQESCCNGPTLKVGQQGRFAAPLNCKSHATGNALTIEMGRAGAAETPLANGLRDYKQYKHKRATANGGNGGGSSSSSSSIECISRRCIWVCTLIALVIFLSCQLLQNNLEYSYSTTGIERSDYGTDSTNSRIINETLVICAEQYTDTRRYMQNEPRAMYADLPIIYFVTPTYPRREQIPELTRLAHTLLHVARLHWIVANDHNGCNLFLDSLLNRFGIPYTHLASPMPTKFRNRKPTPRGVANRRAALQWLRQHNVTSGILYFGDDDNTYDLKLFAEIRTTQRVSMFPVGLIADYSISAPVVRNGKVVGFLDSWVADRRWPVDMAGFAVNIAYMGAHPNAGMPYKPGYEEDFFLRSVGLRMDHIEPKGNNCTEVLVWHTQTKSKKSAVVRISDEYLDKRSNLGALFRQLEMMGVAKATNNEGPNVIISKNGKPKPHSAFLS